MTLPLEVDAVVSQYLPLTDDLLPGRVRGFYLTGSIPVAAFHPGRSDIDGQFQDATQAGTVTPVLWSEMARQSLAVRAVPGLIVHDDHQALVEHTRDNLTSYWEVKLGELLGAVAERPADEALAGGIVPWFVLGVPRLHALLATGNIVSKTAAGEHGAAAFPAHAELCRRAIDHRAGKPVEFTVADVAPTVDFGRAVIASAAGL